MPAVVGDQQTKALADQLRTTNPEDYVWLLTGEGDWHLLTNVAATLGDMLTDAGLKQAAKEHGFTDLFKATGKVKWRDLSGA